MRIPHVRMDVRTPFSSAFLLYSCHVYPQACLICAYPLAPFDNNNGLPKSISFVLYICTSCSHDRTSSLCARSRTELWLLLLNAPVLFLHPNGRTWMKNIDKDADHGGIIFSPTSECLLNGRHLIFRFKSIIPLYFSSTYCYCLAVATEMYNTDSRSFFSPLKLMAR